MRPCLGSCLYEHASGSGSPHAISASSHCRWGLWDVHVALDLRLRRCAIDPCTNPVRSGDSIVPSSMPVSTTVSSVCRKCGTIKKIGKRSCCARGGAWFKKCGDVGDTQFDHTWSEGIRACKSTLLARITVLPCNVVGLASLKLIFLLHIVHPAPIICL